MWDWKLFVLFVAAGWISAAQANVGRHIASRNYTALPSWLLGGIGNVFMLVTVPLAWANVIVPIIMLFRHPWWVVLTLGVVAFLLSAALDGWLLHLDREVFIKWMITAVFFATAIVLYVL
jgi:hypothetical protein